MRNSWLGNQITMSQIVAQRTSSQNILRYSTHTLVQSSPGVRQSQHCVGEMLGDTVGEIVGAIVGEMVGDPVIEQLYTEFESSN